MLDYDILINRNIGLISRAQQDVLKNSCVVVFGLGGLGGIIAEILARAGVGRLKILDHDVFDATNLNRQVFCFTDTIGRLKTDVTEEFLKKINPGIVIEKFNDLTTENISRIINSSQAAVLAIDTLKPCLVISRQAKIAGIPLIEGWAIPFGNVRVFTKDTPSLEETYHLPTAGRDLKDISEQEYQQLGFHMLQELKKIPGLEAFYPPEAVERILKGEIPSFAPLVWLTAVLMSLEAIKVLLNWGKITYAPDFALYNPFK